ncbi:MAG: FG-GAP-like repeat-containing protein [Planctomycetota bacterium]
MDPANDTPEALSRYARKQGADLSSGASPGLESVATSGGWSTKGFRLPAGEEPTSDDVPITHSAQFALVDRRGLIQGYSTARPTRAWRACRPRWIRCSPNPRSSSSARRRLPWLEARAAEQREVARAWTTFHDFRFKNVLRRTGIDFENRVVEDAGRHYKAVHYDHGNGIAVADVDLDGRLDVYFSNQVGSNHLYRNLGQARFEDKTKIAGVDLQAATGVSATFADVDNDGDPDLYVTTTRDGNRLFRNDGDWKFTDVTQEAGLAYSGHSSAAVFFDYDNDGALDLYLVNVGVFTTDVEAAVVNDATTVGRERGDFTYLVGIKDAFSGHLKPSRAESSRLYRNLGGLRFEDVTERVGLTDDCWSGDATPIDIDNDGWLDLYLLNMQGHDRCFRNVAGERFEVVEDVFPRTPWGSMGVKVFDMNADDQLDLYLTDMHSDMSRDQTLEEEKHKSEMLWPESLLRSGGRSIFGNALFLRDAAGSYVEASDAKGAEMYWPWGISVADLNADGYEDVYVTASMNYPYRYGVSTVFLNDAGKGLLDAEFVLGVEPREQLSRPWFELDCSGADRDHPLCAGREGRVTVDGACGSRSSVVFDLDGDGDLDVITNEFHDVPMVLLSNLTERTKVSFLQLRLEGRTSNRDGLGTIVRVTAGGRTQERVHDGLSGYLSHSSMPLYFGLGAAESVDRIVLRWPSGLEQVIEGPLPANQDLVIREGADPTK